MDPEFTELRRRVRELSGLNLRRTDLLAEAFTHPSWSNENPEYSRDYQRLEFVGDAVIDLVVARELYESRPGGDEGDLTQERSAHVKGDNLARMGRELGLGEFVRLGKGEEQSGGADRNGLLEDLFEALIGAIFLEYDYTAVAGFILGVLLGVTVDGLETSDNPKGRLQALCHRRSLEMPAYEVEVSGPDHERYYRARVLVNGAVKGEGEAGTKRLAEAKAAARALELLGED
ncbi:MAG: ribonuclease III [bacterium]|nr:ribonuclease III [bacterium]